MCMEICNANFILIRVLGRNFNNFSSLSIKLRIYFNLGKKFLLLAGASVGKLCGKENARSILLLYNNRAFARGN